MRSILTWQFWPIISVWNLVFKKNKTKKRTTKTSIANGGKLMQINRIRERSNFEPPKYRADYAKAHEKSIHREINTNGQQTVRNVWPHFDHQRNKTNYHFYQSGKDVLKF